jgi:hypothetical protein
MNFKSAFLGLPLKHCYITVKEARRTQLKKKKRDFSGDLAFVLFKRCLM